MEKTIVVSTFFEWLHSISAQKTVQIIQSFKKSGLYSPIMFLTCTSGNNVETVQLIWKVPSVEPTEESFEENLRWLNKWDPSSSHDKGGFFLVFTESKPILSNDRSTSMKGFRRQHVKYPVIKISNNNNINWVTICKVVVVSRSTIAWKGDNQESIQWLIVSQQHSWTPKSEWASHFGSFGPRGLKP